MNAQACLRTPAAGESRLAEPEQTLPSAAAQLTEKWKPPKIVLPGKVHPVRNCCYSDLKPSAALFLTG